jgi:hypothetical protein
MKQKEYWYSTLLTEDSMDVNPVKTVQKLAGRLCRGTRIFTACFTDDPADTNH